jgi:hypothetical protein
MTGAVSVGLQPNRRDTSAATRPLDRGADIRAFLTRAAIWFERPSVAYVLLVLLQLKVIWNDWKLRDLTSGDTSSYFVNAARWAESGTVDIVWSPLYASYYGTLLLMTGDAANATWIHRTIITFTTAVLVLATMRQFLPPVAAWLVAAWWTMLESAFSVHYEVHVFAIIPLLAAILVATKFRGVWGRALTIAILAVAAVLIRNEYAVAALLFGGCCGLWELRQLIALKSGRMAYVVRQVSTYAAPLVGVALLVGFYYSRSIVKFPELVKHSEPKHTLNICQVYAVGYQQRYEDWKLSPWTECQDLMTRQFGAPLPSLGAALRANPPAMIEHFLWNAELTPNGIQVSLFNAMAGSVTPDYGPVPISREPVLILSAIALAVIVVGCALFVSRFGGWARRSVAASGWGWAVLICSVCVTMLVIPVERPRPEYIYPLTLLLMTMVGMSVSLMHALLPAAVKRVTVLLAPLALLGVLIVAPSYYASPEHRKPQGLLREYQTLKPYTELVSRPETVFLKGDYAGDLAGYLGRVRSRWMSYEMLDRYKGTEGLDAFLAERGVTLFFVNQRIYDRLMVVPAAAPLLTDPDSVGWKMIGQQSLGPSSWMLLERVGSPTGASTMPSSTATAATIVAPRPTRVVSTVPDVAETQPVDGLLIGSGWYPPEQAGAAAVRRFGAGAEITVTAPSGTRQRIELDLDLQPDPGGRTVKLVVTDSTGQTVAADVSPGRRKVIIPTAVEAGKSMVLQLGMVDASSNAPVDPQLLRARVYEVRWADG